MATGLEDGGPGVAPGGVSPVVPLADVPDFAPCLVPRITSARLALNLQHLQLHAPRGETVPARAVERMYDVGQMVVGRSEQRHAKVQSAVLRIEAPVRRLQHTGSGGPWIASKLRRTGRSPALEEKWIRTRAQEHARVTGGQAGHAHRVAQGVAERTAPCGAEVARAGRGEGEAALRDMFTEPHAIARKRQRGLRSLGAVE